MTTEPERTREEIAARLATAALAVAPVPSAAVPLAAIPLGEAPGRDGGGPPAEDRVRPPRRVANLRLHGPRNRRP